MPDPRSERPAAPPDDLDSTEEAVEEAIEFFSPDERPPSDDQLTRFPPDENKDGDEHDDERGHPRS